jgi:hypothetical protein
MLIILFIRILNKESKPPLFPLSFCVLFFSSSFVLKTAGLYGMDYSLYRGAPSSYHSEICIKIIQGSDNENKLLWDDILTMTRNLPVRNLFLTLSLYFIPVSFFSLLPSLFHFMNYFTFLRK